MARVDLTALSLVVAVGACGQPASRQSLELPGLDRRFEQAFSTGDIDALAALFAEDARLVPIRTAGLRPEWTKWFVLGGRRCCEPPQEPADLVVNNVRIFTAVGPTIDAGFIVIRNGRIDAVGAGAAAPSAARTIDGGGMTALPGLIDVHRHFLPYSHATSDAELQAYIDSDLTEILEGLLAGGLTTVMSPGDVLPEMAEVRQRLKSGDLVGPRLFTAGPVFTAPGGHPAEGPVCRGETYCRSRIAVEVDDPDLARAKVREVVEMGADAIKVVIDRWIVPDRAIEEVVFRAIAAESQALDVPLIVHAESAEDMLQAATMGADRMAHTPLVGSVDATGATSVLAQSGIPVATTVSWSSPDLAEAFDRHWEGAAAMHKQALENIRQLLDGGVVVAFGTDNPPPLGLTEFMVEVKRLGTVLSAREVLESMTINAAKYLGVDDRLGSLETGKVADVILVDGDPLRALSALAEVVVVIKDGTVVFDHRVEPGSPEGGSSRQGDANSADRCSNMERPTLAGRVCVATGCAVPRSENSPVLRAGRSLHRRSVGWAMVPVMAAVHAMGLSKSSYAARYRTRDRDGVRDPQREHSGARGHPSLPEL